MAHVKIYRAVPADVKEIRPGDWVAQDSTYAASHADSMQDWEGRPWHVLQAHVPEQHVEWAGADKDEWYGSEGEKREYFYRPNSLSKAQFKEQV